MTISLSDLHDSETRATDRNSGGQKGIKRTQIGALDPVALIVIGRVAGVGTQKYDAFNFLKGYDWSYSYNAMQRHANLFWAGENIDICTVHGAQDHPYVYDPDKPENNCDGTNLPHPAMAAWHGHTLTAFLLRGIGHDDRPPALDSNSE